MTSNRATTTREEAFVGYLEGLVEREDRAALAGLRRGLGKDPGVMVEVYKHVLRFNPSEREEEDYCLVASLFALHPLRWRTNEAETRTGTRSLGGSLAWLRRETGSEGVERRFVALLNAHSDDLPEKLRHVVSLLRSEEIPVDWMQLLRDLRGWDAESRFVQRRWARAFWGSAPQASDSTNDGASALAGSQAEDDNEEEA